MCYTFTQLAEQVCFHQDYHKHMSNALPTILQQLLHHVIGIFQLPYNLMGQKSYIWSIVDYKVVGQHMAIEKT